MTRRRLAIAFSLFLATTAEAVTRVTIDPQPPFYADEQVRITLTSDEPNVIAQFDVTADNMSLVRQDVSYFTHVWGGSFYFKSGSGRISIRGPGRIEGPTSIPFEILPPLVQPWSDAGTELRRLMAANRPPVIVRAELLTPRPLVGQRVTVMWNLYHPVEGPGYVLNAIMDERTRALNVENDFAREPPAMVPIGGLMLWRNNVLRLTFTPTAAGRVTIPPLTFLNDRMTRLATGLEFDVRAAPAEAAGLPIGQFTIDCEKSPATGYWPRLIAQVRTGGDIEPVRALQLPRTPYGVLTRPVSTLVGVRRFEVIAHSRTIREMPAPKLRYYDPLTDQAHEITCAQKVPATMQEHLDPLDLNPLLFAASRHAPTPGVALSPENAETVRKLLEKGRIVSLWLAAVGVLGLLVAFRA